LRILLQAIKKIYGGNCLALNKNQALIWRRTFEKKKSQEFSQKDRKFFLILFQKKYSNKLLFFKESDLDKIQFFEFPSKHRFSELECEISQNIVPMS